MSTTPIAADREMTGPSGLYIAFVPWVLFAVLSHRDTLLAGAVVALLAAVVICVRSPGALKLPELAAVVTFIGFIGAALYVGAGTAETIARYACALAAALLALIPFGSLLGTPFTEQYARESVPRDVWSSPRFRAVNRKLTAMWGVVFLAMVPAHLIAGAFDTPQADTIFNWVIPVALIVWAAKRTEAVSSEERGGAAA